MVQPFRCDRGLVILLIVIMRDARAYGAYIEDSEWKTTGSWSLEWSSQQIPEFGERDLLQKSRGKFKFQLKSYSHI